MKEKAKDQKIKGLQESRYADDSDCSIRPHLPKFSTFTLTDLVKSKLVIQFDTLEAYHWLGFSYLFVTLWTAPPDLSSNHDLPRKTKHTDAFDLQTFIADIR